MPLYVYITRQCEKEITQQQYQSQVESFRKKVETTQSLEVFDRFPPPFLKKRFERQIRLVSREYILKDHVVVAFLRLLVRGGSEYKQFGDTGYKELPGFDSMANELTDEFLTGYVNGRQEPPPPPPPKPSDAEDAFLHSALCSSENIYADAHCCETKLWVDTISSSEFKDWKNLFIEAVLETVDCPHLGLQEVRCSKDSNFGLLFRRIPERNMVILFIPFRGTAPRNLVKAQYSELTGSDEPDSKIVLQKAKRAYPHELVLNPSAWLNVQNDEDGNMALSMEEIDVLESARIHQGGFPLFINGSAGSGKSTILQYLFAEFLYHHFEFNMETAGPVLFACNDELLARSAMSIRSILRARLGRNAAVGSPESWLKKHAVDLESSLQNFHERLRLLAPSDQFPIGLLVDYARFKDWWEDRFKADPGARKLYNADVSWHVIRTYIKGISAEDVLDPEDYMEIPAKQKSVTPETYRVVFDNVWKRYNEDQKSKGLWDHQDLARYVIVNGLVKPNHPVVFCDEAQDFTRIELEVLHQSCLFNARTLNSFQLPQVPVAFAGDPFQTLNPTGFRWEATKAFFTDKFIKSYPGQKRGEINYQELTYNYRSSHHIVRFINSLQLARRFIFGFAEIEPQHPWEDDENVPRVVYFERSAETLNHLKRQSEIRIIVPCEAGQEGQWAKENGLADYVDFDEAGIPKNIVSPTGVKGLEFPRVVLYGFGAACPHILRGMLEKIGMGQPDTLPEMQADQAIEPQYFWNRLYVAASRPRKRLFIIDEASDIDSFWNQIFANQESTLLRVDDIEKWENVTGQLIRGDDGAWEGDEEDALKTAEKLEEEGRIRRDRTLLRQAAQSFRSAKRTDDEKRCRAQALELESSFLDAAKLWRELIEIDKSLLTAWNAREAGLDFIIALASDHPSVRNDVHWKIADFLKANGSLSDGVAILKDVADSLNLPKLHEEILMSGVWPHMLLVVLKQLLKAGDRDSGRWAIAYRHAHGLSEKGLSLPHTVIGDLAFRGEQMQGAFDHWEQVPIEERASYESRFLLAKAAILPFPQSLDAWGDILKRQNDIKLANEVLNLVHREGSDRISDAHFTTVVRAQLIVGDLSSALLDIERLRDFSLLRAVWELAHKEGRIDYEVAVFRQMALLLIKADDWQALASLLAKGTTDQFESRALAEYSRLSPQLHTRVIAQVIAESTDFQDASNDIKTRVAELLASRFPNSLAWRHEIHPLIVGRALEHTGLFRLILPFYESVANCPYITKELRQWAWGRWAKVKVRQVAVQGNRKGLDEAREKSATYGFGAPENVPDDLPQPLPPIDNATVHIGKLVEAQPVVESKGLKIEKSFGSHSIDAQSRATTTRSESEIFARTLTLGRLEIRVMANGSRVNVTHNDTGEVLSLFASTRSAVLDGNGVIVPDDGQIRSLPPHWGLIVSFVRVERGKLDLTYEDGLEVSMPVAAPQT